MIGPECACDACTWRESRVIRRLGRSIVAADAALREYLAALAECRAGGDVRTEELLARWSNIRERTQAVELPSCSARCEVPHRAAVGVGMSPQRRRPRGA